MLKELIPQKRVTAELGISRSSLWRASRSDLAGFPAAVVLRARVYWRRTDLPALRAALASFRGRRAFEEERRHAAGLGKTRAPAPTLRQLDLFGETDAAGAEPGPS
jgi:predicted DNA-binding transcriptional regulator AlpA